MTSKRAAAVIVGGVGSTLSLLRALGRHGVETHVLASGRPTVAGASRYCSSVHDVGAATGVIERWAAWLEHEGPRGAVLLPSGDEGLELMVRHRDRLEAAGFRLPLTAGETSLAMLDKARTYELARSVGTPCPRTWTVTGTDDLDKIRDELEYPCALKPLHSHLFSKHFRAKVLIAHDEAELSRSLAETGALGLEMLVTEIIPGPDRATWSYSTYLDETGQPLFELTRNKIRAHPIHFGTNSLVVTARNDGVAQQGREFLQRIGLRGIAHVEFKWDMRDHAYKLIECNHRFVNVQEVLRRAGIDVAVLAYERALGNDVRAPSRWREGVRLWFPERDLKAGRKYRAAGELTWRQWARPILAGPVYLPNLALDDPGPLIELGSRRVRNFARRLRAA